MKVLGKIYTFCCQGHPLSFCKVHYLHSCRTCFVEKMEISFSPSYPGAGDNYRKCCLGSRTLMRHLCFLFSLSFFCLGDQFSQIYRLHHCTDTNRCRRIKKKKKAKTKQQTMNCICREFQKNPVICHFLNMVYRPQFFMCDNVLIRSFSSCNLLVTSVEQNH